MSINERSKEYIEEKERYETARSAMNASLENLLNRLDAEERAMLDDYLRKSFEFYSIINEIYRRKWENQKKG